MENQEHRPKRSGPYRPREDGPHEKASRRVLGDACERQAVWFLDYALHCDEMAARARTAARQLGQMSMKYGGLPPLIGLPGGLEEPHQDEAA